MRRQRLPKAPKIPFIPPKRRKTAVADEVKAAMDALNQFYAIGRQSRDETGDRVKYGSMTEIKERGGSIERLRKARAFARVYDRSELRQLISLCEKHHYPLGKANLIQLLALSDKGHASALRRDIERQMVEGRWTKRQLELEIRKRVRKEKDHPRGRKIATPLDAGDAMARVQREGAAWIGLVDAIIASDSLELKSMSSLWSGLRRSRTSIDRLVVMAEEWFARQRADSSSSLPRRTAGKARQCTDTARAAAQDHRRGRTSNNR